MIKTIDINGHTLRLDTTLLRKQLYTLMTVNNNDNGQQNEDLYGIENFLSELLSCFEPKFLNSETMYRSEEHKPKSVLYKREQLINIYCVIRRWKDGTVALLEDFPYYTHHFDKAANFAKLEQVKLEKLGYSIEDCEAIVQGHTLLADKDIKT